MLVLDIRMPDTSGLELAQLIKQRKKTQHLPIIFLTAYYQEDEHVMQGYGAGAVDYLSKPVNPAILRSKVAVFVDLFRKSRALEAEIEVRRAAEQRVRELNDQLALAGQRAGRRQRRVGGLQLFGQPRPARALAPGDRLRPPLEKGRGRPR